MLEAEGLVISTQGAKWRTTDHDSEGIFEVFSHIFGLQTPTARPAMMSELLEFWRRHFVNSIDAIILAGRKTPPHVRTGISLLKRQEGAGDVLGVEDQVMVEFMIDRSNLVEVLVAHQLRRALGRAREFMKLDFFLYPNFELFEELSRLVDAGERTRGVAQATKIATARIELQMELINAAAESVEDEAANASQTTEAQPPPTAH